MLGLVFQGILMTSIAKKPYNFCNFSGGGGGGVRGPLHPPPPSGSAHVNLPGGGRTGESWASTRDRGTATNSGDWSSLCSSTAFSDCISDGELASGVSLSSRLTLVLVFLLQRGRNRGHLRSVEVKKTYISIFKSHHKCSLKTLSFFFKTIFALDYSDHLDHLYFVYM